MKLPVFAIRLLAKGIVLTGNLRRDLILYNVTDVVFLPRDITMFLNLDNTLLEITDNCEEIQYMVLVHWKNSYL